jgi:flagellar motility protein MotE (MotC chaperone)
MLTSDEIIQVWLDGMTPKQRATYEKEVNESYRIMITTLATNPDKFAETLAKLPEDVRQAILTKLKTLVGDLN